MSLAEHFLATEPLRETVDTTHGALVIEFGAPWCEHCNAAWPHIVQALLATALRFTKESAPKGQVATQRPQPTHFSEI